MRYLSDHLPSDHEVQEWRQLFESLPSDMEFAALPFPTSYLFSLSWAPPLKVPRCWDPTVRISSCTLAQTHYCSNVTINVHWGMSYSPEKHDEWICERITALTGKAPRGRVKVYEDTSNFMSIERDEVVALEDDFFLVRCNERELRCGLSDQPKFWVKRAQNLATGEMYILKLVVKEEFKFKFGELEMRCYRCEEKEGRVLDYVRGDARFMQGRSVRDAVGNLVRVIKFIRGPCLLDHLHSLKMDHEKYFHEVFPAIMIKVIECFRAIRHLHEANLRHGDIRNDHILVERETGAFRWIDFDLAQQFPDYDLASLGNILHVVVGKRLVTFKEAARCRPEAAGRLSKEDGAAFFPHRVMNLREAFPYVPTKLNDVLMRYSIGCECPYDDVDQVIDALEDCSHALGWSAGSL